jgi:hypothetical protein
MKDIVLFSMMVLVAAAPVKVDAAPVQGCDQIVQNLNTLAAAISSGAGSYWAHRKRFLELSYGPSRLTPDAPQLAAQEKTKAGPLKAAMPSSVANFRSLVTTAQTQSCLTPAKLSALAEPTVRQGRRVNFDQFPQATPTEGSPKQTRPRMPAK